MIRHLVILSLFLCSLSFPVTLVGQVVTDEARAREIFSEMDQRRDRITFETSDMEMTIYDPRGRTRNRTIRSFNYDEGTVSKSLLIFEAPANVRGTGFLTLSEGSDEVQKLYLPALGRIQIISASEKSDRFMGSDFTYEDLGDQDPEDYRFELMAERDTSYVLKAQKIDRSQYNYLHFYIEPDRYILQRVEYFNSEGVMIKRLETGNFQQLQEQVWRPNFMVMRDLANDRRTELRWSNRETEQSIPQWRFTERGLRRGL